MKTKTFEYEKEENVGTSSMKAGHIHQIHELYFLSRGVRRYFIDGKIYNLRSGDAVFIPKNTIHHTTSLSHANYERHLLTFSDEYLPDSKKDALLGALSERHFTLNAQEQADFLALIEKIKVAKAGNDEFVDILYSAYISEILVLLAGAQSTKKRSKLPKSQTEQTIESAIRYLNEHLSENLTLTGVSNIFHLSHPYFSRTFKTYTGFGFNTYLTHLRIRYAAELLKHSSLSVSEIAEKCGFSDSNYFSTVFKRIIGHPPKKYRSL